MVVVSTSDNLLYQGKKIFDLFFEHIIPALKLKEAST
jgi:hypothetical protein